MNFPCSLPVFFFFNRLAFFFILRKYQELGESIQVKRVCFSSIMKSDDRPELDRKIMDINEALKRLCLEKGYDLVDNSNRMDFVT